ncbi:MAG: AMP-binding protein [Cyclobacteriaceae bacterium]|nr:AMP-binding protein [Cyclobacteriaceae bacterium]UYN85804.1 MAG: AMP-binding protein [Cyclobacteriaceae bacterium]
MNYPFDSIWINQGEVSIDALCSGNAKAVSEFEASTFSFIAAWLSGGNEFTLQTSGSTGSPKSITFTRNQLKASAARTVNALGLRPGITALVCLNTKYVAGKMMLVRALEHQMKIIAVGPSSDPFRQIPEDFQIDFVAVAPLQLQTLVDNPLYTNRLNTMKAILVGGATVNLKLKASINSLACPVYETFGMTETLSNIALKRLNPTEASDLFIPLPGVTLSLDSRGCLVVTDPIQPDAIITNDVVQIHENGFQWLGRADNVINSGGVKIYAEFVESLLEVAFQNLSVRYNYFIGRLPDNQLGELVALYIEGHYLDLNDLIKLKEAVASIPEKFQRPRKIVLIASFQYTPTGKITRKSTMDGPIMPVKQIITL